MSKHIASIALVGLLASCGTNEAEAGVIAGYVKSVSASSGTIGIGSATGKTQQVVKVPGGVPITVNGKDGKLSDITIGMNAVVFTDDAGNARKITARTATKRKPSPTRTKSKRTNRKPTRKTKSKTTKSKEWHQFRGPNRDNISAETGLLKTWPAEGPKLLWTARGIGEGYSTVSLSDGRIFTMGNRDGSEMIFARDQKTGKELWAVKSGNEYHDGTGNGPRGTPTVDGETVYALGANGDLTSLVAKDGKVNWRKNILTDFGGRNITWGICESVLIDGDKLICTPGGRGATVVALNKSTGRTIWRSAVPGNPRPSYASPIVATIGGVRQYVVFTSQGVIGVRAKDGRAMWGNNASSNGTANCSTPMLFKNAVFSASNYGKGGALVQLASRGGLTSARQVYHTRDMKNHHGGMVIVNGHLYGSNSGILTCLEVATGRVKWRQRTGKGSVTYADGKIYFRSESGPMHLLDASPNGYNERGKFRQPNRSGKPSWAHPVIADGKLYLRDMDVLLCYEVKGK